MKEHWALWVSIAIIIAMFLASILFPRKPGQRPDEWDRW